MTETERLVRETEQFINSRTFKEEFPEAGEDVKVMGVRLEGLSRTRAAIGEKATGVIRLEKLRLGGGPGPNRMLMTVKAQMYIGERWELLFAKDELAVRTYVSAPLKHELYHVEFPPHALWIF